MTSPWKDAVSSRSAAASSSTVAIGLSLSRNSGARTPKCDGRAERDRALLRPGVRPHALAPARALAGARPAAPIPRDRGCARVAAPPDRVGPRRRLPHAPHRVRRPPPVPLPRPAPGGVRPLGDVDGRGPGHRNRPLPQIVRLFRRYTPLSADDLEAEGGLGVGILRECEHLRGLDPEDGGAATVRV